MPPVARNIARRIRELMEAASQLLDLPLCFHDRQARSGLPLALRTHSGPACLACKQRDAQPCLNFCNADVHKALAGRPEGRVHVCPWGFTEIAVPVNCEGFPAGVLFAGPCWARRGRPAHPALQCVPDAAWLDRRRVLLKAVATELGELLRGEPVPLPDDRRRRILTFLSESIGHPLRLADLADELNLSESRTGHLVRELFGEPFPLLLQSLRLREAAFYLTASDASIGEVARLVGVDDANYFSRVFARHFGLPPRAYRRKFPGEAPR